MRIDVITIFPEILEGALDASILAIAREKETLDVRLHDLRDWTTDRHRQVDDEPYGGGPGMVMKPEPFFRAVRELRRGPAPESTVVLLTPQGRRLDQATVEGLAARDHLILLCGRYEGFDERIRTLADMEVSIGDYVLSGGEIPALVVIDTVTRLLPGVLGHEDSASMDSFSDGLLEHPTYTRPPEWEGLEVPDVLRSGDHARIAEWRRRKAIERTARVRPDLVGSADLDPLERELARRAVDRGEGEGPQG